MINAPLLEEFINNQTEVITQGSWIHILDTSYTINSFDLNQCINGVRAAFEDERFKELFKIETIELVLEIINNYSHKIMKTIAA